LSPSTLRILIAVFLIAHGLVHYSLTTVPIPASGALRTPFFHPGGALRLIRCGPTCGQASTLKPHGGLARGAVGCAINLFQPGRAGSAGCSRSVSCMAESGPFWCRFITGSARTVLAPLAGRRRGHRPGRAGRVHLELACFPVHQIEAELQGK
jgi:hypothetical protein